MRCFREKIRIASPRPSHMRNSRSIRRSGTVRIGNAPTRSPPISRVHGRDERVVRKLKVPYRAVEAGGGSVCAAAGTKQPSRLRATACGRCTNTAACREIRVPRWRTEELRLHIPATSSDTFNQQRRTYTRRPPHALSDVWPANLMRETSMKRPCCTRGTGQPGKSADAGGSSKLAMRETDCRPAGRVRAPSVPAGRTTDPASRVGGGAVSETLVARIWIREQLRCVRRWGHHPDLLSQPGRDQHFVLTRHDHPFDIGQPLDEPPCPRPAPG